MLNDKELAQLAIQLLNRVDLKGQEVPLFLQVQNMLARIARGETEVPEVPE